jgi:Glycosyl hydrolases family 25
MRASLSIALSCAATLAFGSLANAEDQPQNQLSRDAFKRLRSLEQVGRPHNALAVSNTASTQSEQSWTIGPDDTRKSTGTFGIDISHHDTDGGCQFNWQTLVDVGLRFVYDEVTRGSVVTSPGVVAAWNALESWHAAKKLFRGAYHFLLPNADLGTDSTAQVNAFVGAIGATNGKVPVELPAIVDIEQTKTPVKQGTDAYNKCNAAGYISHESGSSTYTCDDWYTYITAGKRANIVALAQDFAMRVSQATQQEVLVYSGIGAWEEVMGTTSSVFQPLLKNRDIWMSRYPTSGKNERDPAWKNNPWNTQWNMPTMFGGAPYPAGPAYDKPDFWQFAQYGKMSTNPSSCPDFEGNMDLNYIPVRDAQFNAAFGIH